MAFLCNYLRMIDGPYPITNVRALSDEDVQFQQRVLLALKKITGKDFSADPDVWEEWWGEKEEGD